MKFQTAIARLIVPKPQTPVANYFMQDQIRAEDFFLLYPNEIREPFPYVSMSFEEPEKALWFSREIYLMRLTMRDVFLSIKDEIITASFVGGHTNSVSSNG